MKLSRHVWVVAAALAACSTPAVVHWEKAGGSEATAKADTEQCREQARFAPLPAHIGSAPVTPGAAPVLTREEENALHDSENFQKCMREKGYSAKR